MESSQFTDSQQHFDSLELINTQGATCDTYRIKLYGKLHFLKRLKPEFANDIRYQETFRKEFETGYRLEHPNLVRYISFSDNSILMEYVDGETLTQRLAHYPAYFKDRENADKFVRQLLDVVAYLHSHQVLHLDLKPDNILLTRINDDIKLIDLGYCYTDTFADTQGHTDSFAAPEQLSGEDADVRTDIYAIGRIMQILPCHHIYNKVIARCTQPEPDRRYQTVEELQRTLSRPHVSRWAIWGLLTLAIIVTLLLFIWNPHSAPVRETPLSDTLSLTNPVNPTTDAPSEPDIDDIPTEPVIYDILFEPDTDDEPSEPDTGDTPSEPETDNRALETPSVSVPSPPASDSHPVSARPSGTSAESAGARTPPLHNSTAFQPVKSELSAEEKVFLNDPRLHIATDNEFERYKIQLEAYFREANAFLDDTTNYRRYPSHVLYLNEYRRIRRQALDKIEADTWFAPLYHSSMNPVSSYTRNFLKKLDHKEFINGNKLP